MKTKLLAILGLLAALFGSLASAQTTAFSYQGRLDVAGNPVSGIYDLRFTIYDLGTGSGPIAGPITNTATFVSNGLFTVPLDFGASVFTGGERWLEIGVRTNGGGAFTLLTPRQPISATPYALTAGQISGLLPSASFAGTYGNAITLNNAANNFTGNGDGLTQLNASQLKSGTVDEVRLPASIARTNQVWLLGGNFGTTAGSQFLGTADNQPLEFKVNGQRALRLEDNGDGTDGNFLPDGAPNLIGGSPINAVSAGVVGATIAGGGATNQNGIASPNTIASDYGAIGGGLGNRIDASSQAATIAGGFMNDIGFNADFSVVLGGHDNNIASNTVYGTVGGGWLNDLGVKADFSVVGGGWDNDIGNDARWGVIGGGHNNDIGPAAEYNTVSGGQDNSIAASASYAVIPGGRNNTVNTNASYAFAAGRRAKANHVGTFVWADAAGTDFASTGNNQFLVRASGGMAIGTNDPADAMLRVAGAVRADSFTGAVAATNLTGTIAADNIRSGSITTTMLANGAVSTTKLTDGAITFDKLSTTPKAAFQGILSDPSPASGNQFGVAVAGVGSDKILVGREPQNGNPGAAYLFHTSGQLLATFSNPANTNNDDFGSSLAAVGQAHVIIGGPLSDTGAANTGVAYLFDLNGNLVQTFTNPGPDLDDRFGGAVAAVGSDKVIIGASRDSLVTSEDGAAYLFSTNGTLLTTFTNPTPNLGDRFGWTVAAVGTNRVVIGAFGDDTIASGAGAAYLFDLQGGLVATLTNAAGTSTDALGISLTAVGTSRVLAGAYRSDLGALEAGAAHLFDLNGNLLLTITNPFPQINDQFGFSVAAVGNDRFLIGANHDDTLVNNAGAAYLYDLQGTLLGTFLNPVADDNGQFGNALAGVGESGFVIAASQNLNNTGAAFSYTFGGVLEGLVAPAVADGAIQASSLQPGAVGTPQLADGAVTAAKISGPLLTSQIPDLNATKITSGTLADARLSGNVAWRNQTNAFTANQSFPTGSAASPGLSFTGDDDTGWFRPAANTLAVTTGGAERLRVDAGGNVGIGEAAPEGQLHITGNPATPQIKIETTSNNSFVKLRLESFGKPYWDFAVGGSANVMNWFYSATSQNLMSLSTNGTLTTVGPLNPPSDRNVKQDFAPVDAVAVLEKVAVLPIQSWAYKNSPETRHIGPVAQDFHAAFQFNGADDKHISTVDADGVALAAIQGLNQKLQEKETELTELKARMDRLEQLLKHNLAGRAPSTTPQSQ
jgi:hypothetical protein